MLLATLLSLATTTAAPITADTLEYVVLNQGRSRGEMRVVTRGDSVLVRFQGSMWGPFRTQAIYWLGPNGSLRSVEVRDLSPDLEPTEVKERFEIVNRTARWRTPVDSGSTRADRPGFYQVIDDTPYGTALLASFLLGQPAHTARLLPTGSVRAFVAADTSVLVGSVRAHLRLVMIEGLAIERVGVWLDDRGRLVASEVDWFITVRRDAEAVLPTLRAIELRYRAHADALLAQRLAAPASSAVVIRNGDLFDSERGIIVPRTTVVIEGERVVALGPEGSVTVPAGARVIDATGKTVLPGLWEMHSHRTTGLSAVVALATGVTTMRNLGDDIDVMISQRDRAAAGVAVSPRVLLAGYMDGPARRKAVPTDAYITTEEEARRWVARYDSLGYRQIKLYDDVHPILVPAIADEAKQRGMRLSGHLPIGISVPAAIHLGFDEIHHVFHLVSTFFPDSQFIPRQRPQAAVAMALAPRFDVDAPGVTALLALLRERGTVIDGTFIMEQDPAEPRPDGAHPVFGPTLEWMTPLVRRGTDLGIWTRRAQALRAVTPTYLRLLKRLFDAGVTLVPGTDIYELSYHSELEIYERAGIPANRVLQIATIVPARVMGDEKEYGSIAPGKIADLVVVDGQPATRIRDLRRTEFVVRAGRVFSTRALYAAAGLTPRR